MVSAQALNSFHGENPGRVTELHNFLGGLGSRSWGRLFF
jgi:hypothetical protein